MACLICDIIQKKVEAQIIYEDEDSIILLHPQPAAVGHIIVAPKQHFPIFEATPDPLNAKMFLLANKMSSVLFDGIGSKGTNLLINNGVGQEIPHFFINIISRTDQDGIIFDWLPKQIPDEEMSSIQSQLSIALNPGAVQDTSSQIITETIPEKIETTIPRTEEKTTTEKTATEEKNIISEEEKDDISLENKETTKSEEKNKEKEEPENYLVKQLKRMP